MDTVLVKTNVLIYGAIINAAVKVYQAQGYLKIITRAKILMNAKNKQLGVHMNA